MAKKNEKPIRGNEVNEEDSKMLSKCYKKALKKWRENYDDADYMKMSIKSIIEHCFVNGYLFGMIEGTRLESLKKIIEETDKDTIITRHNH